MAESEAEKSSRWPCLHQAGPAALAGAVAAAGLQHAHAAGAESELRVGLIGCGGRGSGAASQALRADKKVRLTAMADAFADRLSESLENLRKDPEIADKISVDPQHSFVGFDAYQRLLASEVDVVLLATPPHFRPLHLAAAVEAGKHIFAEKPVAVDSPGVRSVLETCRKAEQKGLSIVSGLCLRYLNSFREVVSRIHDGAIGEIVALQVNDLRGPIWSKSRQSEWTDMEWQLRNWYYFTWLSGDFNVEQHIHFLDVCAWILGEEYPTSAVGQGGRQVRTGAQFGNIYDHHSVIYGYAGGRQCFSQCRQQAGCSGDMSVQVLGTTGQANINEHRPTIVGEKPWQFRGQDNDLYQAEHDDLFASIRSGAPVNHGSYMANSTLMAIQGRMATYTGQNISWDQAWQSQQDLTPASYAWGALPTPAIAVPGATPFR